MKKILSVFALVTMLTLGTGVVGASDSIIELEKETEISVVDSSFSTINKKPIVMD